MSKKMRQRLEELKQQKEAQQPTTLKSSQGDAGATGLRIEQYNEKADGAKEELKKLDLGVVYERWFSPQSKYPSGAELNVSCFNDSFHKNGDKNPQLGINSSLGTYFCHACQVTGDIIDLAAIHYGFADSNYKCPPEQVHRAVKEAGTELCNMSFQQKGGQWYKVETFKITAPSSPAPGGGMTLAKLGAAGPAPEPLTPTETGAAPIVPSFSAEIDDEDFEDDDDVAKLEIPPLDWRDFIPKNTPLRNYLEIVEKDDTPEEFHFWNFLQLIGLVCGRDIHFVDRSPVYGNLNICVIGKTGSGKSRAQSVIKTAYARALHCDLEDPDSKGVRLIQNPGSGEVMVNRLGHECDNPAYISKDKTPNLPKTIRHSGIRGVINWPEISTMVSKGKGQTSTVMQAVIEMYDAPEVLGGESFTNSYTAHNAIGAITTTTQLSSIRKLFSRDDTSSGFLNRWSFVVGRDKPYIPIGDWIDISSIYPDIRKLENWVSARAASRKNGLHMATEARDEVIRFLVEVAKPLTALDDTLSRSDVLFKKLILLASANMMEDDVSLAAVYQAETMFHYLVGCMNEVSRRIKTTVTTEMSDWIIDYIKRKTEQGSGAIPSELKKIARRRFKVREDQQIMREIRMLEQTGEIQLMEGEDESRPGRNPKRYVYKGE